jgi:hypothetical protein
MKRIIQIMFSIFFAIAIGVHLHEISTSNAEPLWWHCIYFLTYGVCWWMIFSKNKNSSSIYLWMAIFPFVTHIYYGYQHLQSLDSSFWVCVIVCVLLPLGFIWLRKEIQ